jgi:glycosyltransferase involved in cell wall biosynthesis
MTKASIIFLSYQHEQFIAEALVSALEQDHPDVEVIVADDGSTDRTKEIINEVVRSHPAGHRAKILPDAPNMGIVANWNRAVAAATGDVLVAMASDDIATPDRVSKVVCIFDSAPEVMAVFSQVSLIDAEGRIFMESFERHRPTYAKFVGLGGVAGIHFWQGAPVLGACGCYRAVLARDFPPLVEALSEDQPFVYRALLCGAVAYIPDRQVFWRWHGRNASLGSMTDELCPDDALRRRAGLFFGRYLACSQYARDAEAAFLEGSITRSRYEQEVAKIAGVRAIELLGGRTLQPETSCAAWVGAALDVLLRNVTSLAAWAYVARSFIKYVAPVKFKLLKSRAIR